MSSSKTWVTELNSKVEGVLSLAAAPVAYFYIPNDMSTAWFLSAEQKEHAAIRYERNKDFYNPDEKFTWGEAAKAMRDWKVSVSRSH
jgi:hypothetical protein